MSKMMSICAWCKRYIKDDKPVWSLPCKSEMDLTKGESHFVDLILLSGKTVTAFLCTEDSEAKAQGYDFVFMCCSKKCARKLKSALEQDKRIASIGSLRG